MMPAPAPSSGLAAPTWPWALPCVAVGLAAVYGIGAFQRNARKRRLRPEVDVARRIAPLARGELAAFVTVAEQPLHCRTLHSAMRAATTPSLALARPHAAAQFVGDLVRALPKRDAGAGSARAKARRAAPSRWWQSISIPAIPTSRVRGSGQTAWTGLGYYADPSAKVFQDLKIIGRAAGMPTTLLIDRAGCEIGTVAGPAEWASGDAVELVTAALAR